MQVATKIIKTPLGNLAVCANSTHLLSCSFVSDPSEKAAQVSIENSVIEFFEQELLLYFSGKLTKFRTPTSMQGSAFQKQVWEELKTIPFGATISYKELATRLGKPKAVRAVGNANGANKFPIIIPCHRVIQSSGSLGGYAGGIEKKAFLISLEQKGSYVAENI